MAACWRDAGGVEEAPRRARRRTHRRGPPATVAGWRLSQNSRMALRSSDSRISMGFRAEEGMGHVGNDIRVEGSTRKGTRTVRSFIVHPRPEKVIDQPRGAEPDRQGEESVRPWTRAAAWRACRHRRRRHSPRTAAGSAAATDVASTSFQHGGIAARRLPEPAARPSRSERCKTTA